MEKIVRIKELVKELNQYRDEYYNKNKPSVSDAYYDKLFDELSTLEKETGFVMGNSPTCTVGYTVVSKLDKMEHPIPLLSLEKTKLTDELIAFVDNKYSFLEDKVALLMLKLDGLTVKIEYDNGLLRSASTRGDGNIGEIITHNIPAFKNVPMEIPYKGKLVITGEAYIHIDDFEKINESLSDDEEYSTPRNLTAGSVRCLDSEVCAERKIYFSAFNVLNGFDDILPDCNSKSDKLKKLQEVGFDVCRYTFIDSIISKSSMEADIERLKKEAITNFIPIDGMVITYDDIKFSKSCGRTGHHYKDGLAFKFEDDKFETILRKVEWNPTRLGDIAPVAIFDTVVIDGCDVSRATLHNITFIKNLELNIGCRIKVCKRNMIIPHIEENMDRDQGLIQIPEKCPCCGDPTYIRTNEKGKIIETLCCSNENCPASKIKKFVHFVSKPAMNIEGLSEATIEKFIQKGFLTSFVDFFHLDHYQSEIEEMDGFGKKSYQKLWDSIQKCKKITFEKFLIAMDIPKVGKTASKLISKEFSGDVEQFENAIMNHDNQYDFTSIPDIGDTIQNNIYSWFYSIANKNNWYCLKNEVEITFPEVSNTTSSTDFQNEFTGKTIVVTGTVPGYTRSEMQSLIVNVGAISGDSVTKKTDLLVIADKPGASKVKKAGDLGIKTMHIHDFLAVLAK